MADKEIGQQPSESIARIRKHQNELQSSNEKMMEGLPQKLKKAQSEGLTTVQSCKFVQSMSNLVKFL